MAQRASQRVARLASHVDATRHRTIENPVAVGAETCAGATTKDEMRWNGWGFTDTAFKFNSDGQIYLSGDRYELSGVPLPSFRSWAEKRLNISPAETAPSQPYSASSVPAAQSNPTFSAEIQGNYNRLSTEPLDRLNHAHGHTCQELMMLRNSRYKRVPDVVIWPGSHEHVVAIVAAATRHNVVIIPYGGGTSVTYALMCPEDETRMIVSLDMHEMNKIKWVDRENMTACIEAGIPGMELDRKLREQGVVLGHEPDSSEFSTVGGWIATRASGMKKNIYGNIEDLLVSVRMVTPTGVVEKHCNVPRISAGPDVYQMILGSEGTLGVVTDAVFRVRPAPTVVVYGAVAFPNFECGVKFMREVALQRLQPASIRLMDNEQFLLGQALKPMPEKWQAYIDHVKRLYVTMYKGFDVNKMCAATLLFEGNDRKAIKAHEARIYAIGAKYSGLKADEDNGRRGYALTFMIAYIRDFGFEHGCVAESFETSVPWAQVNTLCTRVKARVAQSMKKHGIKGDPFISCRVTQTYDAGACIYFYFAFKHIGQRDPVATFNEIEHDARDEILKNGGSISHHHGIGKHRKGFMPEIMSPASLALIRGLKASVDPTNIFANGNLL